MHVHHTKKAPTNFLLNNGNELKIHQKRMNECLQRKKNSINQAPTHLQMELPRCLRPRIIAARIPTLLHISKGLVADDAEAFLAFSDNDFAMPM
jgi:hypothetical protein